jgi:hypothetical protein
MRTVSLTLLCVLFAVAGVAGDVLDEPDPTPRTDRVTFTVRKAQRGTSLKVPESQIISFCGDADGCVLRLGMFYWDNTGRVSSRESLFYYNPTNRAWRASLGDSYGTDFDGQIRHVMQVGACYFTDGKYYQWKEKGDAAVDFGLLSWNEYMADCSLTIID